MVGPVKCGHAAKTLAAHERHDDLITFLGIPRKLDHVVLSFLVLIPCINALIYWVGWQYLRSGW